MKNLKIIILLFFCLEKNKGQPDPGNYIANNIFPALNAINSPKLMNDFVLFYIGKTLNTFPFEKKMKLKKLKMDDNNLEVQIKGNVVAMKDVFEDIITELHLLEENVDVMESVADNKILALRGCLHGIPYDLSINDMKKINKKYGHIINKKRSRKLKKIDKLTNEVKNLQQELKLKKKIKLLKMKLKAQKKQLV